MMSNSHLGPCAPSGSFSMMSMSLSVQSPAERMWTLKKSSSGAEVMVNGCHSSWEMAGQLRKTYWPTSILKPLFTSCSSSTLDGRMTIWRWRGVTPCITKKKTTGGRRRTESESETYSSVLDCLQVPDQTQDTLAEVQNHRADHIHPGLRERKKNRFGFSVEKNLKCSYATF